MRSCSSSLSVPAPSTCFCHCTLYSEQLKSPQYNRSIRLGNRRRANPKSSDRIHSRECSITAPRTNKYNMYTSSHNHAHTEKLRHERLRRRNSNHISPKLGVEVIGEGFNVSVVSRSMLQSQKPKPRRRDGDIGSRKSRFRGEVAMSCKHHRE